MSNVNTTHHKEKAEELTRKLVDIVINGGFPFDTAADFAKLAVKEMVETYSGRVSRKTDKGYYTHSAGKANEVAYDHYVRYFTFTIDGDRKVFIGLGYDIRHWIYSGEINIPWRVYIYYPTPSDEMVPDQLPNFVENKIRHRNLRDGYSWIYKGMDVPFLLIPKDKLPDESEDDTIYTQKLAKVVFEFLDDLFGESSR